MWKAIVRDLTETAIEMVREEKLEEVEDKAELNAEERLLDLLLPPAPLDTMKAAQEAKAGEQVQSMTMPVAIDFDASAEPKTEEPKSQDRTREKLRQQFREGKLDDRIVEIDARDRNQPNFEIVGVQGGEETDVNLKDLLPGLFGNRSRKKQHEGFGGFRVPDQ